MIFHIMQIYERYLNKYVLSQYDSVFDVTNSISLSNRRRLTS